MNEFLAIDDVVFLLRAMIVEADDMRCLGQHAYMDERIIALEEAIRRVEATRKATAESIL